MTLFVITSCQKEEVTDSRLPIDNLTINPNEEPSRLSKALKINGRNISGTYNQNLEEKFTRGLEIDTLRILSGLQSASISNDNYLFIPIQVNPNANVCGAYIYINGADNFWKIESKPVDNILLININIPNTIANGYFSVEYRVYDNVGNISPEMRCDVTVEESINSCRDDQSGSDGLTIRSYYLGQNKGQVRIGYTTYTIKDRIDIRYGGEWYWSTGDLLDNNNPLPPIKDCQDVLPGDGFVGESGSITIDYDPADNKRLDIYVSGCLNDGTAWDYSICCPQ